MKIAVGITTRNRPEVLAKALVQHRKYLPKATGVTAKLFIVDDASTVKAKGATWRFEEQAGIAKAKNKLLELGEDWGADHFFLFDDDTWPQAKDWWKPYVESPEHHLMYIFEKFATEDRRGRNLRDITKTFEDTQHSVYGGGTRGCMLYATSKVLEVVGGMDEGFGRAMFEHPDWTNRIYNAGLTTFRVMDVAGSDKLIYSMDEHREAESSISPKDRSSHLLKNQRLYDENRGRTKWCSYREVLKDDNELGTEDVVLSSYFTSKPDFQRRNEHWEADASAFSQLVESVKEKAPATSIHIFQDAWPDKPDYVSIKGGPHFERFFVAYKWLLAHPEVRFAWIVDSTDVTMLNAPQPLVGKIYVGVEPSTVANPWLREQAGTSLYRQWIRDNCREQLLNCGILGGERRLLLEFLRSFLRSYEEANWNSGLNDMLVFNRVARNFFPGHLVYGEGKVNNVFKSYAPTPEGTEWWLHK